jgi:hypothetical protein
VKEKEERERDGGVEGGMKRNKRGFGAELLGRPYRFIDFDSRNSDSVGRASTDEAVI